MSPSVGLATTVTENIMFMKNIIHYIICGFAAIILFAGFAVYGGGGAKAQDANTIVMKNFDFSPMMLTVKAGTTVTWKNLDGEPHTVVSPDGVFRSHALDQGDVFTFTFDKPGTYKYICSIHPKMRAAIIVQ
jgi:plastocyanin